MSQPKCPVCYPARFGDPVEPEDVLLMPERCPIRHRHGEIDVLFRALNWCESNCDPYAVQVLARIDEIRTHL